MSAWSPARMPRLRDQTARRLADRRIGLQASLREHDPETADDIVGQARHLLVSDLFWVTAPMAALAIGSAATLDEVRWTVADRPSNFGLVIFDGGIGHADAGGAEVPVAAASWAPDPNGTAVALYVDRRVVTEAATEKGLTLAVEELPPLMPFWVETLPAGADWTPVVELPESQRTVLTAIYATWTLMQQTTLAARSRAEVDRDIRRSYGRAQRPEPTVSIVDLRRQYVPAEPAEDDGESGRTYRHRWVVNGHWRNQPYGPGRAQHRKQWIPAYVKGPDGAPMLETTRVNVWRR